MSKEKEYPIDDYIKARTNKDRACVCCGDMIAAGNYRMMPKNARPSYCMCLPCFMKWRSEGRDPVHAIDTDDVRREYVIHMSKVMRGNCDIVKGRKLYVSLRKAMADGRIPVIRFEENQPISLSMRIMGPSVGKIMDEYGKDVFDGNIKIVNAPKGAKDLILGYIEKYKESCPAARGTETVNVKGIGHD